MDHDLKRVFEKLGIKAAVRLVARSPFDAGRMVFETDNEIYKIVLKKHECTASLRKQTLAGEYSILKHLSGCPGVPQNGIFFEDEEVLILSYAKLPGTSLGANKSDNARILAKTIIGLGRVLIEVSRRGICHNDISLDNVLVGGEKGPFLIDFDQASRASFGMALISNFTGWNSMTKSYGSFVGLIPKFIRARVPKPVRDVYRGIRQSVLGRYIRKRARRLKPLPKNASTKLCNLHAAWELARHSDANSPGEFISYYSLYIDGFHLPGERSWIDRWAILRNITDVRGKRVLELGCNLSLLSCHFLLEEGAAETLCVDQDADILTAAQRVAAAYGVNPIYHKVNFDSTHNWEEELACFSPDIVTALSVLNWVQDKNRLLRFLGRFDEVLFEGHDSEEIERNRLAQHGFSEIRLMAISERGRPILHGRKPTNIYSTY